MMILLKPQSASRHARMHTLPRSSALLAIAALTSSLAGCGGSEDAAPDQTGGTPLEDLDARFSALVAAAPQVKFDFVAETVLRQQDVVQGLKSLTTARTEGSTTVVTYTLNGKGLPTKAMSKQGDDDAKELWAITYTADGLRPTKATAKNTTWKNEKEVEVTETTTWTWSSGIPFFDREPATEKNDDGAGATSEDVTSCSSSTRCKVTLKSQTAEGKKTTDTIDATFAGPRLMLSVNPRLVYKLDAETTAIISNVFKGGAWAGKVVEIKGVLEREETGDESTAALTSPEPNITKVATTSKETCTVDAKAILSCTTEGLAAGKKWHTSANKAQIVLEVVAGVATLNEYPLEESSTSYDDKDPSKISFSSKKTFKYDALWRPTKESEEGTIVVSSKDADGNVTEQNTKLDKRETEYTYVGLTRRPKTVVEKSKGKVTSTSTYAY
jgi:hypothetical protein